MSKNIDILDMRYRQAYAHGTKFCRGAEVKQPAKICFIKICT